MRETAPTFPKPITSNGMITNKASSFMVLPSGTWHSLEAPSIYPQQELEIPSRKEKENSKGLH